jgi:antitoxin component YwqK of YwqJK toxin-antitoxin module
MNGLHHGSWVIYDRDGNIYAKGLYNNGEYTGEWVYYNEDGTIKEKVNY